MKVFVNGVEKTLADGMPLTWDGAVVLSGRDREGDNLVTYCCEGEPEQWLARGHGVVVKEGMRITVGACTTYRIVDGKAVPVAVSFPEAIQPPKGED